MLNRLTLTTVCVILIGCAPTAPTAPAATGDPVRGVFGLTPPPLHTQYGVLLCRTTDNPTPPPNGLYYSNLFTSVGKGTGNVIDYWLDQSYGKLDLSGTSVIGTFDIGNTEAVEVTRTRTQRVQDCVDAAVAQGTALDSYFSVIAMYNVPIDLGSPTGVILPGPNGTTRTVQAVVADSLSSMSEILHEMGHSMGLDHSFGTQATPCAGGDGRPGAYCDKYDIMSTQNVFWEHSQYGLAGCAPGTGVPFSSSDRCTSGPGLDAWNRLSLGWLPSSEVDQTSGDGTYTLAALNHPEVFGTRLWKTPPAKDGTYYTIEYLRADNWYAGLPSGDKLIIHLIKPNDPIGSYIDVASGGPALGLNDTFDDNTISFTVTSIDSANGKANFRLHYDCHVTVTCAAQGASCGSIPDGCGGFISCGGENCPSGQTCGGAGVKNVCGTPSTCVPRHVTCGRRCGIIDDGCGNQICCGNGNRCCDF